MSIRLQTAEIAAKYVSKIYSGKLSAREQETLEDWLAKDPKNMQEYENMLLVWDKVADCDYSILSEKFITDQPLKKHKFFSKKNFLIFSAAASFCFIALFLGIFYSNLFQTQKENILVTYYKTRIGEQKDIKLPDGSLVTLNTASELEIDFTENKRQLKLKSGEAFFDIAKSPNPLTVDLGKGLITVLGTQFNVNRARNEIVVAVVEGLVSVDWDNQPRLSEINQETTEQLNSKKPILLSAGKVAYFSEERKKTVPIKKISKLETRNLLNWRQGFIHFDKKPLTDVVAQLNRYTHRKISVEDSRIAQLPVSGLFELKKVELILEGIDEILPIQVIYEANRYVIIGDNN